MRMGCRRGTVLLTVALLLIPAAAGAAPKSPSTQPTTKPAAKAAAKPAEKLSKRERAEKTGGLKKSFELQIDKALDRLESDGDFEKATTTLAETFDQIVAFAPDDAEEIFADG